MVDCWLNVYEDGSVLATKAKINCDIFRSFGMERTKKTIACIRIQREVTAGEGLTDEEKETVC